jgi:hypothetical protein
MKGLLRHHGNHWDSQRTCTQPDFVECTAVGLRAGCGWQKHQDQHRQHGENDKQFSERESGVRSAAP